MLTDEDLIKIGTELGKVVEENVTPGIEELGKRVGKVETRLEKVESTLNAVNAKLDRALYKELDRHERWIKQIADKVGVTLDT